jgi:hypothetical protein
MSRENGKKSMENSRFFIGFQNTVCTGNIYRWTQEDLRVSSISELKPRFMS